MTVVNPLDWTTIQPQFQELQTQALDASNVEDWLQRWSDLEALIYEANAKAYRAKMENTASHSAEAAFLYLLENILPPFSIAANQLKQKLLGFKEYQPTSQTRAFHRRIRVEAEIFRESNVPLLTELGKLAVEYDKIVGALEIDIDGETLTFYAANAKLELADRAFREAVFRAMVARWRLVRDELDALFVKMLPLRRQIALNAGFANYRDFVWLEKTRFDYSPADTQRLHEIIYNQVVPIAKKLQVQRRLTLGLQAVKPWDTQVPFDGQEPLRPFQTITELETKISTMFHALDPELGAQFETLRSNDLLLLPQDSP